MARTLSPTAKLATGITALALAGTLSIGGAWALGTQLRDGSTVTSTSAAAAASPSTAGTQPVRGRGFPGGVQTIPGYAGPALGGQVASAPTEATAAQLTGVVDIVTTVDYGSGEAAGTGIVLTSDGEILTNNHVIEGSTSIEVTVLSTGQSFTAHVVGTSPTNDIAVLRLDGASGLATAPMGDSSTVAVGDAVVGVGNAGNEAGTSAAAGTVTA
ncbi:MAG TPA: trypsin-like peptidase domain-containing protein, partial [Phycicoccus sp.]|nr:trypsin-like peptidase domain-containing protein [Phycicoccus sp.]